MRIATLDLGTNSFLCLIGDITMAGEYSQVHDESVIVRLGQDLQKTGKIHPEALQRAEECLKKFSQLIQDKEVNKVRAVATAAAREALNASDFIKICQKFNIPLATITGEQEARMSFRGAIDQNEKSKCLLIDIGGGSTEYIVGTPQKIEFAQSLGYGAVKLTEAFVKMQPVSEQDTKSLIKHLRSRTEEVWAQVEALKPEKIVAVAGTPTALVATILGKFDAKRIEGYVIEKHILWDWMTKFAATSIDEKKFKFGLGARADVIYAGTVILYELLERIKMTKIYVSTKGIRYGLAYQMVDDFRNGNM